jgi:hypothetical protein
MSKTLESENRSLSYPYKVSQKLSKSDTDKLKKFILKVFIDKGKEGHLTKYWWIYIQEARSINRSHPENWS